MQVPAAICNAGVVNDNKSFFPERLVKKADVAMEFLKNVGVTPHEAKAMVKGNMIRNCPITTMDIDRALKIYGPPVSHVKGKTTRKTPKVVNLEEGIVDIPTELIDQNQDLELCIDAMHINNFKFLTGIDLSIRYRHAEDLPDLSADSYYKAIDNMLQRYNAAGFHVSVIHADNAFHPLLKDLRDDMDIQLNFCNPDDHVPQAERNNRTLTERI